MDPRGIRTSRARGWWVCVLLVLMGVSKLLLPTAAAVDSFPAPTDVAVRIDTVPSGISVEVDDVSQATPYMFVCPQDSVHFLNATNLSIAGDVRYVFTGWDDGMTSLSRSFVCDVQQNFTVVYETQYRLDFVTSPSGLRLSVNGTLRVAPFSVWCTEGSRLQTIAFDQMGSVATQHTFMNWSDGGAASHSISCDGPGSYAAGFLTQHLIGVSTTPNGLAVTVDGASFGSPYNFWCVAGSSHTIGTPSVQMFNGQQMGFTDWSDGGDQTHMIRCDRPANYTASFATIPPPPAEPLAPLAIVPAIALVVIVVVVLAVVGAALVARSSAHRKTFVAGLQPMIPMAIPSQVQRPAAVPSRICPECGRDAEADWTYCAACGTEFR